MGLKRAKKANGMKFDKIIREKRKILGSFEKFY